MQHLPTLNSDRVISVTNALQEDIRSGDITAQLVDKDKQYSVQVIAREPAIFCGLEWVVETFQQIDPSVRLEWLVKDGEPVKTDQTLFKAKGNARSILTAERTALNFLQLLSGTATLAGQYAQLVVGTTTKILDTRKTIPGLRSAQKYAVQCGGCFNHRIGLYDAFLIKENHIAACGSIESAISTAKQQQPGKPIEIEVESLDELKRALDANADIIMLDNFSLADTEQAVKINRSSAHTAKLEASGNMSLDTIPTVAATGVDYISVGSLTKNIQSIDISMRFNDDI
jgi:nicotinate-nucleotide pyrophosphorylase (carboxylating)